MGAGDARLAGWARCFSPGLRALAALALVVLLSLRLAPSARAAVPSLEPQRPDACDPCVTIVDRPAWDETVTVVDVAEHDETVTVVTPEQVVVRTVVDVPARELARHDLILPERMIERLVLVEPAHSETYLEWVADGYWTTAWTTVGYWETNCHYSYAADDVVCTQTYHDYAVSSSVWIDTSRWEERTRLVPDRYATVTETLPAVYDDWVETIPALTHEETEVVPTTSVDVVVHVAALTHTAVVHHDALTHQEQASLATESRQGADAAASAPGATAAPSALIVIPVVSTITVVDQAASREEVTVIDVPERTETRTVVVAPATTVVHRDLVTPETTTTRTVVVTPETTESVVTWVASGYPTSSYVSAGYWDTYNCHYSSWIDDEVCSERWVDTSYYLYGWVDTSHWETGTRTVPAVLATVSEVVPAVYDEWVEVVPEQVVTETLTVPAVTHVEYVARPAATHSETLRYDAIVDPAGSSGHGSDPLADFLLFAGLAALAGAGRYLTNADSLKDAAAQWAGQGKLLSPAVAALVEQDAPTDAEIAATLAPPQLVDALSAFDLGSNAVAFGPGPWPQAGSGPTRPTREEIAAMSWAERRAFIERVSAAANAGDWLNAFLGVMDYAEASPALTNNRYMKEWDAATLWAISEGAAAAAGQTTASPAAHRWGAFFQALRESSDANVGGDRLPRLTDAELKRLWGIAEQAGIDEGRPWALDRARPVGQEYAVVEELKILTDEYRASIRENRPLRITNAYPELALLHALPAAGGLVDGVPVDPRTDRALIALTGRSLEPYIEFRAIADSVPQGPLGIIPPRIVPPTYETASADDTSSAPSSETMRVLEAYSAAGYPGGDAPEDVSRAIDAEIYGSGTIQEYFAPTAADQLIFDAYATAGYPSGDAPEDVSRVIDAALFASSAPVDEPPMTPVYDFLDAAFVVQTESAASDPTAAEATPATPDPAPDLPSMEFLAA